LRLLEAAGAIFAEHGYRDATLREICRRAETNLSSVKYHFGGKERLYRATVEYSVACSSQQYPYARAEDEGLTPHRRLRAFIAIFLRRLLDPGRPAWHGRLLVRELNEPTAGFDLIAQDIRLNLVERLMRIWRGILGAGAGASDEQLRDAAYCVIGQCTFYRHARQYLERHEPRHIKMREDIEAIAERVYRFSLGAMNAPEPAASPQTKGGTRA
jgi:AcrR family transcriptional regulator